MRRPRYVEVRSLNDTLMLLLTGAIAGTAAGVYLGRRYGSVRALVDDVRYRLSEAWDSWNDDELEPVRALEDEFEGEYEDELLEEEEGGEHAPPDEEDFDELHADATSDDLDDDQDDDADEFLDEPFDDIAPVSAADELPPHREADVADIPSTEPEHRSLEAIVLQGFEGDEVLRRRAVDITAVGEGVIELTGWVRSGEEAARAAALARTVPGVEMVLNRITVRSPEELADETDPGSSNADGTPHSATHSPRTGDRHQPPPEGLAP